MQPWAFTASAGFRRINSCRINDAIVVVMELVGKRYRPMLGTAVLSTYSFGFMMQPAIAFFLRDEFWYQVAATVHNFVFPFVVMFVCFTTNLPFTSHSYLSCCEFLSSVRTAIARQWLCCFQQILADHIDGRACAD